MEKNQFKCNKCQKYKSNELFKKDIRYKDGFEKICYSCKGIYKKVKCNICFDQNRKKYYITKAYLSKHFKDIHNLELTKDECINYYTEVYPEQAV